jgi:hypothetical protein
MCLSCAFGGVLAAVSAYCRADRGGAIVALPAEIAAAVQAFATSFADCPFVIRRRRTVPR